MTPILTRRADRPGSQLGQALLRLQRSRATGRAAAESAETEFSRWQSRWRDQRTEVARRLELLDEAFAAASLTATPVPLFSIVRMPDGA